MENDHNKNRTDPGQRKWDKAGPDNATGRSGGGESDSYTEGEKARPRDPGTTAGTSRGTHDSRTEVTTENERRFGGSHTAGTGLDREGSSEWKGGTPSQGPTTGGMGSAGGGHDANDKDETDVWGDQDKKK